MLQTRMGKNECTTCQKPKATLKCELCHSDICKICAQFLTEDAFTFLEKIPPDLTHSIYCSNCHEEKIAPQIQAYDQTMELAKDINVYFKAQGKETRTFKRKAKSVTVTSCPDYNESVLRLAFLAAQLSYNALIDVQLTSKKVFTNGYQNTVWTGSGIPTHVTEKQLNVGLKDPNKY